MAVRVRRLLIFLMLLGRQPKHNIGASLRAQRVRVVRLLWGIRVGESVAVCLSRPLGHRLRLGAILEVNVGLFVGRIITQSMRLLWTMGSVIAMMI
jgi:hypothetical protein